MLSKLYILLFELLPKWKEFKNGTYAYSFHKPTKIINNNRIIGVFIVTLIFQQEEGLIWKKI